jgi:predicted dehydrogenase
MSVEHRPLDRRKFLRTATTGAAIALSASSYAKVPGSNSRVNVGFIGCGGRAQAHINLIVRLALNNAGVSPVAVCDVWDGLDEEYEQTRGGNATRRRYTQGLFPAAVKCGLMPSLSSRVVKDYRRLLDLNDVDAVCISTPNHWHARQTIDAMAAGKDVYVEKPMTRTASEAIAVTDAAVRQNRVVCVGVQSLADPIWKRAHQLIHDGQIGHVSYASAAVFRNDPRGQWRYYRLSEQMTSKTIDWDLFLGHRFEVNGEPIGPNTQQAPFEPALFAQWRCYRPFSSGPFSDLLSHPATRLLCATGLRHPYRVVAAGGLFVEHDGRTVPDVGSLLADFDAGAQLSLTATTTTSYPAEDLIRGRNGTLKFVKNGIQIHRHEPGQANGPDLITGTAPTNETEALWIDFLDCVRRRDRQTMSGPELGATTMTLLDLAARSYDDGRAYGWDAERRMAVPADATWLANRPAPNRV